MNKKTEKRILGYIRVSSKTQNEARQKDALKKVGVLDKDIYLDKQSGKDFYRPAYMEMIQSLQRGDEVIILDLDRLGRNYQEMAKEWHLITNDKGCDIRVLNCPLLNTVQERGH